VLLLGRPQVRSPVSLALPRVPRRALFLLVVVAVAALVVTGAGRVVTLAVIGAGASLVGARLLLARRQRAAASATAGRVLEVCEQLAAELASGSPPGAALDRAAADWPPLRPVAEAARVGADVPSAWRSASSRAGAGDLRLVGAAWQVGQRTGSGLADAVARVARDLRADRATSRVVDGELASARATARLIAALPLLALLMGTGSGGDPWGFLFGHPAGLACLGAGLACGLAGLWWIELLARDVRRAS
jgi:tight adherence protein B